MPVDVRLSAGGPEFGTPHRLFSTSMSRTRAPYDVSRDGQRFLVTRLLSESAAPPLTVMLNWPALLAR